MDLSIKYNKNKFNYGYHYRHVDGKWLPVHLRISSQTRFWTLYVNTLVTFMSMSCLLYTSSESSENESSSINVIADILVFLVPE